MTREDNRVCLRSYLRTAGIESLVGREEHVERAVRDLIDAMSEKVAIADPASLYTYRGPMLTEDGTCSIVDELAPVPYDLAGILGGRSEPATRRRALPQRLGERAQDTPGSDWAGRYQRRA